VISPDGSYLLFNSDRPVTPDSRPLVQSYFPSGPGPGSNIWRTNRQGDYWSDPVWLGPTINDDVFIDFASVAADDTLYYMRLNHQAKAMQVWRSHYRGGKYLAAEYVVLGCWRRRPLDPWCRISANPPTRVRDESPCRFVGASTGQPCVGKRAPGGSIRRRRRQIGELFRIEAEVNGRSALRRRRMRQTRTVPVLKELKSWMNETLAQVSAKSPIALAIGYSLGNWTALTNFVDDGRIDAHNNTAERALRGVALGRKNYLHFGSDAGGHTAAVMYTLLGTARLNGVNPQRYLRHVLERIADHPSNRIDELLPWAVAAKWADDTKAQELPLAA
jgi:hypothetical protein